MITLFQHAVSTFGLFECVIVIYIVLQQKFHAVFWRIYVCFIRHWSIGFVGAFVYLQVTACTASWCQWCTVSLLTSICFW